MSTDHDEDASFDAIYAAVRHAQGNPTAARDIDAALDRLSGTNSILAHMSGWAAAVRHVIPAYAARTATLAAVSCRTGRRVTPDGRVPTDILLGARLAVAMLNDDPPAATALWNTARDIDAQDTVVRAVLEHMAGLLAPHMPTEETPTDV